MRTVTASATTLFHLAAEHLGDPTQWWRIARENNLTEPEVRGVVTLRIPDRDERLRDIVPQD